MKRYWLKLRIPIAIILASLVIGISIILAGIIVGNMIRVKETVFSKKIFTELGEIKKLMRQGSPGRPEEPMPGPGSKKVKGVDAGTSPVKGDLNAPILMVEFSDFQCPFSKRFYQETFPKIEKEYISTGKVKFAYRDFPLPFHPLAQNAAIAVRCAGKQNKYWEVFDKLARSESLDEKMLKKISQESGLKAKDFELCRKSPESKEEIKKELSVAQKFGVNGTPAFFINGRLIEGAYPFEIFKQIIDEELANLADKKR